MRSVEQGASTVRIVYCFVMLFFCVYELSLAGRTEPATLHSQVEAKCYEYLLPMEIGIFPFRKAYLEGFLACQVF